MNINYDPWKQAVNHPAFKRYSQDSIDEMTIEELYEIYDTYANN